MKVGLPISLLLHSSVAFGAFWLGGTPEPLAEGRVIPIELVTLSEETNIAAALKRPEAAPPEPETDAPMELASPMAPAEEVDDAIKAAPEEVSEPVKQAELIVPDPSAKDVLAEPVTDVEPAPETPSFDLDKLSAMIDRSRSTAPELNQQKTLQSETERLRFADRARAGTGEGTAMTLSELDALQSAMYKCWRMPADAQDPEKLIVRLRVKMLRGGLVEDARVIDRARSRANAPGNPFWDVAEQRAVRAVAQCAPYDFLPDEKYMRWQELTLNFRPQL